MGRQYRGLDGKMVASLVFVRQQVEAIQTLGKPTPEPESKPVPVARTKRAIKNTSAAARVAAYMEHHSLNQIEFSQKAHFSDRTLRRLLNTGSACSQTWAETANAMGIPPKKLLK